MLDLVPQAKKKRRWRNVGDVIASVSQRFSLRPSACFLCAFREGVIDCTSMTRRTAKLQADCELLPSFSVHSVAIQMIGHYRVTRLSDFRMLPGTRRSLKVLDTLKGEVECQSSCVALNLLDEL